MIECRCFFVSDLHGKRERYRKLVDAVVRERPAVVLLGGDLFPFDTRLTGEDFFGEILRPAFVEIRDSLGQDRPRVLLILGNDDPRDLESNLLVGEDEGLWTYLHRRSVEIAGFVFIGYSFVPPTPFMLKDWERYDVSRHADPGCVSPEHGRRTVRASSDAIRYRTIRQDLDDLARDRSLARAVFLFHSPPYGTDLDRAALDGKMVDHVPLDVHVGSIAMGRFIKRRQPLVTLHGHIHESARLTGNWQQRIGRTFAFSAAHDGPELALVRFDLENIAMATRELI